MNKRIRYAKDTEGFYASTRMVQTAHGEVLVKYNPESRVVLFLNGNNQVVNNWVCTVSNHEMKKEIKRRLLEMGAEFEKETRSGSKGE